MITLGGETSKEASETIGLHFKPNFVTNEEASDLVQLILSQDDAWKHEGFEELRKVQRYKCNSNMATNIGSNEDETDGTHTCISSNIDTESGPLSKLLNTLIDRLLLTLDEVKGLGQGQDEEKEEKSDPSVRRKKLRPNEIVIEERKILSSPMSSGNIKEEWVDSVSVGKAYFKLRPTVSIFESYLQSEDEKCSYCCQTQNKEEAELIDSSSSISSCSCYVAQISLMTSCKQSMNKPKVRDIECWDLDTQSPLHSLEFTMNPNELILKTDESLWNYRSQISAMNNTFDEDCNNLNVNAERLDMRNYTIKFRCIHGESDHDDGNGKEKQQKETASSTRMSSTGATLSSNSSLKSQASSPLHELLTIIVTTSPIKSNPSTEVLERTFDTFSYAGIEFCYNCPKIIICDGCRIKQDESAVVTNKHANTKQRLRSGIATSKQAENYELFKIALRKLCDDAGSGVVLHGDDKKSLSPFRNTRVVELDERHGYGFALRHALRHEVSTPYVCVIQHDRTFMRHTPIQSVVQSMTNSNGCIKYVGMNMRSNLTYRDTFTTKYGSSSLNELLGMVLKPPELALDSSVFGPNGTSVKLMLEAQSHNKALQKNLKSLAQTYLVTVQSTSNSSNSTSTTTDATSEEDGREKDATHQLSLTPTLFWYDNTHVCETSHYRDFIFNPAYKMVAKGGFVEDKLSPAIIRSVERLGLREGHSKFGCYILDDHSGYFFTGHLDGGSYMTTAEKKQLISGEARFNKK